MTSLRDAAQAALKALEGGADSWQLVGPAIDALRAALAENERDWSLLEATQESLREHMAEIQRLRAALAEPVQEPVDVGNLEYRGNSVGYIYQKMTAYRNGIDAAWDALRAKGIHPDGKTRLAEAIARHTAPPKAEPVQEPVAWIHTDPDKPRVKFLEWREDEPGYRGRWIKTPLYAALPQPTLPPEAQTEAEKIAYCAGWWDALEKTRKAEPVQEPVAWQERQARRMRDGVVTEWTDWYPCRYRTLDEARSEASDHIPYEWRPLYTTPPQRKPLSVTDLQEALVYANLIDRDAIDDPDNYDEGSTLAQIDALHQMLTQPQRKPLTREEAIALWADKSDGPSNGEIVAFARAVERARDST